jgi:hypothetical protein
MRLKDLRKEGFLLELSRTSDFLGFDGDSSEYPDELNEGEDGRKDGDGEHVPLDDDIRVEREARTYHHHHLFPWSGDPAWDFSVLRASEVLHFSTVSADVLFRDIPRGKTGLEYNLAIEKGRTSLTCLDCCFWRR